MVARFQHSLYELHVGFRLQSLRDLVVTRGTWCNEVAEVVVRGIAIDVVNLERTD